MFANSGWQDRCVRNLCYPHTSIINSFHIRKCYSWCYKCFFFDAITSLVGCDKFSFSGYDDDLSYLFLRCVSLSLWRWKRLFITSTALRYETCVGSLWRCVGGELLMAFLKLKGLDQFDFKDPLSLGSLSLPMLSWQKRRIENSRWRLGFGFSSHSVLYISFSEVP